MSARNKWPYGQSSPPATDGRNTNNRNGGEGYYQQHSNVPAIQAKSSSRSIHQQQNGENYEAVFKIILLGDSGVGKSNLLLRFTKDEFICNSKTTVGVEFASKTVQMDNNKLVKAQIWDTAGQERYRLVASSYYRRAVGALLVFDVTDRKSFDHAAKWLREVEEIAEEGCLVMLVGNKIDLTEKREVSLRDGREFAKHNKIAYIETSARTSTGVAAAFQHLLQAIYNQRSKMRQLNGVEQEDMANKPFELGREYRSRVNGEGVREIDARTSRSNCCAG